MSKHAILLAFYAMHTSDFVENPYIFTNDGDSILSNDFGIQLEIESEISECGWCDLHDFLIMRIIHVESSLVLISRSTSNIR